MAEIKIEQKKQNWLWMIVGLVVAAILVYFIVFRDNNNSNSNSNTIKEVTETSFVSDTNDTNLLGVKENNSTMAAFVSFVENDNNRMSLDHAYTNEALLN